MAVTPRAYASSTRQHVLWLRPLFSVLLFMWLAAVLPLETRDSNEYNGRKVG